MDYNWTSLQLGTSETVIVQHDLSQGYNYTNFGLVNSMCIPFILKRITLHFLRLETPPYDDTQSRTDIKTRENCGKELYNVWIHFSPTCRQKLNINVVITIYCQQNLIFPRCKESQFYSLPFVQAVTNIY